MAVLAKPETEEQRANVARMAMDIALLDPGSAAALRRGPLAGSGSAAFWKLMADHDIEAARIAVWATVAQSIAILTPVGEGAGDPPRSAHDSGRSMGAALHHAGVSELRLARLLAAGGHMRRNLVLRVCRRLARSRDHRRFDLRTLARAVVYCDEATDRQIARDYYRAESAARARDSHTREE